MAIVASALLLVLATAAYFRHLRTAGVPWLFAMRVAVLVIVALILLDAVVARYWNVRPGRVAVVVDRSLSMTARSADSQALAAAGSFPIPAGLAVEPWVFGDTLARGGAPAGAERYRRTLLGEALRRLLATRPGAVLLFTDGQDNGELDPVRVARDAAVPVYVVGCGTGGGRNVAAGRLLVPKEVYAGDTFDVFGRISYAGIRGEEVTVRLAGGSKTVRLRDEVAEQEFAFRHVFAEPGRRLLRFSVDSLPGESDYADNTSEVTVDVRPARLRVAYVSDRPGPGTRFVTRSLAQDPRVEVEQVVFLGPGRQPATDFLEAADVLVVDGGVPAASGLLDRVEDGVGLLLVAGPDMATGGSAAALLPGEVRRREGTFSPVLAGPAQLLGWLGDDRYQAVPPFAGVLAPASGAGFEVWLAAAEDSTPLVMAYRKGRSRVVYVAGYPLWRWGFGPEWLPGEPTPLDGFLHGTVRYLAQREAEPLRLTSGKPGFFQGEPVELVLAANAPDGSAWTGLDAVLVLDSAGSGAPMTEDEPGVYRVRLDAVPAGEHRAEARVRVADSVVGSAALGFTVGATELELASTGLSAGLLRSIARASRGDYFRWDSLPARGFVLELGTYQRGFRLDPRRTPWLYVLLVVLAGAEWVLRRRKGLL